MRFTHAARNHLMKALDAYVIFVYGDQEDLARLRLTLSHHQGINYLKRDPVRPSVDVYQVHTRLAHLIAVAQYHRCRADLV